MSSAKVIARLVAALLSAAFCFGAGAAPGSIVSALITGADTDELIGRIA